MATSMHRLQISLPRWQARFLAERARRDGVSIAEWVRQLVRRESAEPRGDARESFMRLAGIAEDRGPLLQGTPVSEDPDLYLHGPGGAPARASRERRRRKPARRR